MVVRVLNFVLALAWCLRKLRIAGGGLNHGVPVGWRVLHQASRSVIGGLRMKALVAGGMRESQAVWDGPSGPMGRRGSREVKH